MMKIRKYRKSDIEQIKKLTVTVITEFFNSKPNVDDLDNIDGNYEIFYVAEINGKIIGTAAVMKINKKVARLRNMHIYQKYRDKGYGKKLLEKTLNFCKKHAYKEIILSTYPKLTKGTAFYKNQGFVEFKREDDKLFFRKIL